MINLWITLQGNIKIEGRAYTHVDLIIEYATKNNLDIDDLYNKVIDKG